MTLPNEKNKFSYEKSKSHGVAMFDLQSFNFRADSLKPNNPDSAVSHG
jgi:hypothetical protein